MKKPYTIVQFTSHTSDGDTMYRRTWPMQALASLPEFRVIDVHYMSPYRYQLAFDADLLVLGMMGDVELVPILRWRRAKGKATVFEVDNNIFETEPWNPTFPLWNNLEMRAATLHMIAIADLFQTSSRFLAELFQPYCSRIAVFPNQLASAPDALPRKDPQPLVVGWGGSLSHIVDMAHIAPAVSKWITEHEGVVLSIMGDQGVASLFTVPPEKKRFIPWADIDAYHEFLKGVHVGLAPLRDTPLNRGRSDVKWLEFAANGCVFVGQRVPPYTESVKDGKTGFLFDDAADLVRILGRLYQNRSLMESVRRAAFDYVTTHRRYDNHIQKRADVYKELLDRKPPAGAEKWDLHERARFPRISLPDPLPDYLPLKLETEEQRVLDELCTMRPDVSENAISAAEQRYGEFHLTAYSRAILALARADLTTAEQLARRALSFYPASVPSLDLLGEILIRMRRFREARDMLSLATQWNHSYGRGYHDLVTAMQQEGDWDAAIAVTVEWEEHCNQDPLARATRGLLLIQSDRKQEAMETILQAMNRIKDRFKYWQLPFAAELAQMLRQADPLMSDEARWPDLILEAAEMFPYGLWLPARAGAICFERGDYQRGARILQRARERLLAWEWQRLEGGGTLQQYQGIIEAYRTACEELAQ